MSKELIEKLREDGKFLGGNFGKLMHEAADALEFKVAQSAADVDRGIDDSARLPVVAWQVEFPLGNGAKVYEQRPSWAYESYGDLAYVTHELCRLTDAQARLAEKDARIAQLAAHARGKNKALANALKEIERLKKGIDYLRDNLEAAYEDRKELRAQLEQLQAPAERGVVVLKIGKRLAELLDEDQWAEIEPLLARLNPAPSTADSDVREVK